MVKLAIRDDDMNFFTKVEDIEYVYRDFNHFPISFAVIPKVMDVSTVGACPDTRGNSTPKDISANRELISWLRQQLENGSADVLLHGETHEYKFISGKRFAEMEWREKEYNLVSSIKNNRKLLEDSIGHPISCFVAPSNKIARKCIKAVAENGLNFSGIIDIKFSRAFTLRNIYNYIKRWSLRVMTNLPYPGVMKYSDHLEISACLLQSYDYLVRMFEYCKKHSLPMVVNVHYWHLRDNPKELKMLRSFVMDYAIPNGAEPSTVSSILNSANK